VGRREPVAIEDRRRVRPAIVILARHFGQYSSKNGASAQVAARCPSGRDNIGCESLASRLHVGPASRSPTAGVVNRVESNTNMNGLASLRAAWPQAIWAVTFESAACVSARRG
jgi:hypothetical protein